MDLSKASERTRKIHRALAQHPLGSAREIGDTLGEDPSTVANALRRADIGTHAKRKAVAAGEVEEGERAGLAFSVTMGRVRRAVKRSAHTFAGLIVSQNELGVSPQWYNGEHGLRHQAGQLQLVEVVDEVMPSFWQQNTVGGVEIRIRAANPFGKIVPVKWWQAELQELWWLRSGPIDGVARYQVDWHEIFLPFKWVGSYHGQASLRSLDGKLPDVLDVSPWVDREVFKECVPGVVVIVSDPVVGAQVGRFLQGQRLSSCIVDAQGRVLQPMINADFPWLRLNDRDGRDPVGLSRRFQLGEPEKLKAELEKEGGPLGAVNGRDRWRTFYDGVAPAPGLTCAELVKFVDMPKSRVREYVAGMEKAGVAKVREGMVVPDEEGWEVLAVAEGVKRDLVKGRLKIFADEDSSHCNREHSHTAGLAAILVAARRQGNEAF